MDSKSIDRIDDPQLRQSISTLLSHHPDTAPVIQQLIDYFTTKLRLASEPPDGSKKRKLDSDAADDGSPRPALATIQEVSVQSPPRGKLTIVITATLLFLSSPKTPTTEYRFLLSSLAHAICVCTPEKTAKSWTIALFSSDSAAEPIIFGFPDKDGARVLLPDCPERPHDVSSLCTLLSSLLGLPLVRPAHSTFVSSAKPAASGDRKGESSHHVTAFLKAKYGALFPLPTGLLFGFRKPILFIPLADIASTTFHGVTSRTFNMTVRLKEGRVALGGGGGAGEYEFSVIEQADFGAIDAYMKNAQVADESLSMQNRAVEKKQKEKKGEKDGEKDRGGEGDDTTGFFSTEYEEDEEDGDFQPEDEDDDSNPDDDEDGEDDDEEDVAEGDGNEEGDGEDEEDELMQ
ncbi:hypothetical protein BC937DRAFT_95297 [Endogone sp. FLAS-F59071]|nr:hypothetical protein BC937DRAFT_95297 [Endogone sp. FLAS-F59071]|eukprot:RUS20396.1 hypothetical protein BC937DRAFT_95297 [Endogone sp. FLAS-F59071]